MLPILRKAMKEGEAKGEARGLLKGRTEGRTEGRAGALLKLLAARGISVDAATRRRIQRCKDLAQVDRWFDRALSARRLSEVLDDLPGTH